MGIEPHNRAYDINQCLIRFNDTVHQFIQLLNSICFYFFQRRNGTHHLINTIIDNCLTNIFDVITIRGVHFDHFKATTKVADACSTIELPSLKLDQSTDNLIHSKVNTIV